MLTARSIEEAHIYLDLHVCEACGEPRFEPQHWLEDRDGQFVAVYEGACPACGAPRRTEFALPEEQVPPPAIGDERPSVIIDPGEFFWISDRAASKVPGDVSRLSDRELIEARVRMQSAVAALEEVIKFLPPDAERVPAAAFVSEAGVALNTAQPNRFERDALENRLSSYRAGLAHLTALSREAAAGRRP